MVDLEAPDASAGGSFRLSRREMVAALLVSVAPPARELLASPGGRGPAGALAEMERLAAAQARGAMVSLSPGPNWNGLAGSGFGAVPVDPVRTTAKPAMRLLVPPGQVYVDRIVVGVAAGANDRGDCLTNLGLEAVEVHFEGQTARIEHPTVWRYRDAAGVTRSAFGWWAELIHDGRNMVDSAQGGAEVWFRAIPRDPTMQARVMGPYRFHPRAKMHDLELVVAPSRPAIAGKRYPTLQAAAEHIRTSGANFARITIVERGLHEWGGLAAGCHTWGYTVVDATVPVVIGKAQPTTGVRNYDAVNTMRTRLEPICFRGANLTLDFRNVFQLYHERPTNRQHWLDGCTMTNSDPAGRAALWRKGARPIAQVVRDWPWFTEVTATNLHNAMYQCSLARNCTLQRGAFDVFTESLCVYGNRVDEWDTTEDWTVYRPALDVSFAGEGEATLACSGNNLAASRVFTAKVDGTIVGTFATGNGDAVHFAGTNYDFAGVARWLNGLPGWSARVIDNRYLAASNQAAGTIGAWGPLPLGRKPLRVFSYFDLHADFYQKNATGAVKENVVIMDNQATQIVAQDLFFTGSGGCADFFAVNNTFVNKNRNGPADNHAHIASQLTNPQSHVVIAFNSLTRQSIVIRGDLGNTTLDPYCLISDNAVREVSWRGKPKGDGTIRRNAPPNDGAS